PRPGGRAEVAHPPLPNATGPRGPRRPARRPGRAGDERPAPAARGVAGDRDRLLPAGGIRPGAAAGDDRPRPRPLRPTSPRRTPGRPRPALRADRVLVVRPPRGREPAVGGARAVAAGGAAAGDRRGAAEAGRAALGERQRRRPGGGAGRLPARRAG